MGKFARSWRIVVQSFAILRSDKELMFLPFASALSCITASVIILSAGALAFQADVRAFLVAPSHRQVLTQGTLACFFLLYFVNYTIVIFFNVALVSIASNRLAGGRATINDGLQAAWQRKTAIIGWALLAATVGIVLSTIQERIGWLGRLVVRLIGVAWALATFFVVPLLAEENLGPVQALWGSADLVRENWGEEVSGGFSFGMIFGLLGLPVVFLFFAARTLELSGMVAVSITAVLYWVFLSIVSASVQGIFTAALYRYAKTKQVTTGFTPDDLSNAWTRKS